MKLQTKLALAFAGTVGVVALAGCPNMAPSTNPTPTPVPSAAPSVNPLVSRLIIQKVVFRTAAGATQGNHEVFIKNATDADITDLDKYVIAYHPTTTNNVATSSILNAAGDKLTTLSKGGSLAVFLYSEGTPTSGTQAETTFTNAVQYGAGGGLAIFKDAATTSANITDFVQWGKSGTAYESVAAGAHLWTAGTTVATVSVTNLQGANLQVITEKATGSTNFQFNTF